MQKRKSLIQATGNIFLPSSFDMNISEDGWAIPMWTSILTRLLLLSWALAGEEKEE